MDQILAYRLESDQDFERKISKIARDYLKLGRDAIDYWSPDFDASYDTFMCYASLTPSDFEKLVRNHPKRFVLPMTATQITTMTTYISQMLFGQETPHKVEARHPDQEVPSEFVNQLLRWNSEQQPTYLLGHLWVQDTLLCNRGIFYNSWAALYDLAADEVDVVHPGTGEVVKRVRTKKTVRGGFAKYDYVAPYDWVCDPALPLYRFQDGRFSGHRTTLTFTEIEQRSKLPVNHPQYVLPSAVEQLRAKKTPNGVSAIANLPATNSAPSETNVAVSRSSYERTRSSSPIPQKTADKNDVGVFCVHEMWIRLDPVANGIYDAEEGQEFSEPVIFQFLIANGDVVLSINESTYLHDQYPYSVAEARPHGLNQFSPSWSMILQGTQQYVDWLKNRHQEALSRSIGNIFIIDPEALDADDFMNPEKEGLLIAMKPGASGRKLSDVFTQVPIKDLTENFGDEMATFINFSETASGATVQMQGQAVGNSSATEYAGVAQMGAGRMAAIARNLSVQALVPQAKQIVSNFQQFLDQPQAMRFVPTDRTPDSLVGAKAMVVTRDRIQGQFDFIAHDGTLPGADQKKVAAITKILEAGAAYPQIFAPGPGNLDPRKLIFAAAKASGVSVQNFKYTGDDATPAAPPAGASGPLAEAAPTEPAPVSPLAPPPPGSASATPGPKPEIPTLGGVALPSLPPAGPPQIRPAAI